MVSREDAALDAPQRAVVLAAPDRSAVVVGAPGSGKTTALIARVAALVDGGLRPDAVLALTPSRQTATALRDRLALTMARATAGPLARSVASFAFQVVRAAAVAAGDEPPQLLTGGDEDQLVHDLLEGDAEDEEGGASRWPEWVGRDVRANPGFRTEVRAFAAECTAWGISPDALRALGEREDLPAWVSLASFLREYHVVRGAMRGAHRDAAGLLREAAGLLREAPPGIEAIDRLRAIVVDDAQELTRGGVELLEAARARGIAVIAFGDPDVASGAFRGATPENFARLCASLGETLVLGPSRRGTPWQIDVVRRVAERIGSAGVVAHRSPVAGIEPDSSVRVWHLRSPAEEFDAIARLLRERHVHDGVAWGQCAVIAHDTRQLTALEAELSAREVPARSGGPGRALGVQRAVRDLVRLVEVAMRDEWTFDDASDVLLGVYGRLDAIELRRLTSTLRHVEVAAGGVTPGRDLVLSAFRTPLEFELADTREARRAARVAETVAMIRAQFAAGGTAHELLWTAWERSGLERAWSELARGHGPLAEQANRDLDAVVGVFQAAKRFVERSVETDPRAFVRGVLDSAVAEDRLDAPAYDDVVRILTPAATVGLEFDTVVIAGVQESVWPNTRLRGSLLDTWRLADAAMRTEQAAAASLDRRRSALHDELRLFARSLSRSTALSVITAVDDDDMGPSVLFEFLPDPEPLVAEHPLSLRGTVARHRRTLTTSASTPVLDHAASQLAVLADAGVAGAHPHEWYGVLPPTSTGPLRDLTREDVRVSPSRLHTLEECQLNWVIGDLGGDPGGSTAGIGTIIHAALEHALSSDEASLWHEVEARWGELSFEAEWRARAERTRAQDLVHRLHLYLHRFESSGGTLVGAEPHFEIAIPLDDGEVFEHGAVLSGYIDRVELTPEGTVVIMDLKTGKREPQTDAKVVDNPQLAAYQLAFEAGAIPEAAEHPAGGAKLLVLRPTASGKDYVTPWQPPFDDERRDAFLGRIRAAVTAMRGTAFSAPYEEHCRDEFSYGLCRIHTIGAVSSS